MVECAFSISDIVELIETELGTPRPNDEVNVDMDWSAEVPQGTVAFLNAFRQKYFEYEKHFEILSTLFSERGIERVVELGCGTAPQLVRLAQSGYQCTGIDTSKESLRLASGFAKSRGVAVSLIQGDAGEVRLDLKFDAAFMMYLPLSPKAYSRILQNLGNILEKEGLFIHTDLLPSSPRQIERDEMIDIDVRESSDFRVARLEHWWKNGNTVAWNAIYFVRQPGRDYLVPKKVHIFTDHNRMCVMTEKEKTARRKLWKSTGFKLLCEIPIPKARSAPPWTKEVLVVLEESG